MLLTVKKIGPLLDLFSVERPEWGVTEVAERLHVSKSSAHALLRSLAEVGLLSCTVRGRYRLGWRFLDLGETLKASLSLRGTALPFMRSLASKHRETVQLSVLDRERVLFLERIEGTHPVRFSGAPIGARWPSHATASGKVLLSVRPKAEIAQLVQVEGLRAITPNTITDIDRLCEQLEIVRRVGYALDVEESVPGVSAIAAPLRLDRGVTVAALTMALPTTRFRANQQAMRKAVIDTAAAISHEIRRVTEQREMPGHKPPERESRERELSATA